MEEKLADNCAVARQVSLERANVLKALVPNIFADTFLGQLLCCKKLGMDTHDERLLIIAAVKNSDASTFGQRLDTAPEVIVIKILGGW